MKIDQANVHLIELEMNGMVNYCLWQYANTVQDSSLEFRVAGAARAAGIVFAKVIEACSSRHSFLELKNASQKFIYLAGAGYLWWKSSSSESFGRRGPSVFFRSFFQQVSAYTLLYTASVAIQYFTKKYVDDLEKKSVKKEVDYEDELDLFDFDRVWSSTATETVTDLIGAYQKAYYTRSHGRIFAQIDSRLAFLQTSLFSACRFIKHIAFAILGAPLMISQYGRSFVRENLIRSTVDSAGVGIGAIGTLSTRLGERLVIGEFNLLDRIFLSRQIYNQNTRVKVRNGELVENYLSNLYLATREYF